VVPLAARRASRTCFDGAARFDSDLRVARTGASIRGSSMVDVVLDDAGDDGLRLFEVAVA